MSYRSLRIYPLLAGLFLTGPGCLREAAEPEGESEVESVVEGLVQLSSQAQETIGLVTGPVVRRPVTEIISTTGWLKLKPGNEIQIKAAATGFVLPAGDAGNLQLGSVVTQRQELGKLRVLLSPQEEAQLVALKEDADILIEQSLASLAIAEDRYDNAKNIANDALARKDLHALEETVKRFRAAVSEARDKLPFLPHEPYERPVRLDDAMIRAPMSGHITGIHVRPGQLVLQGDPLWTLSDWSTLWVRAPVFEGDLSKIDQTKTISISVPGEESSFEARPTGVPQPTEDGRRTVDLLYELENADLRLRPGQAVAIAMSTGESAEQVLVPRSALLWDGMGNSWVYVRASADTFHRQRVQVGPFVDAAVVIERGLENNQEVVVVGAEAVYGEEFKSQIDVGDDD